MIVDLSSHFNNFYGALDYAIKKEGAKVIGGADGTVADLANDYEAISSKSVRCEHPTFHFKVSIDVGERLSDAEWVDVGKNILKDVGYKNHMFTIVRHTDRPHEHIHIIGSRVGFNGKVPSIHLEELRASLAASIMEEKYNLRMVSMKSFGQSRGTNEEFKNIFMKNKGELDYKSFLKMVIDVSLRDYPTASKFLERMGHFGIGLKANIGGTHISGISYEVHGRIFKGKTLGRDYTWNGLLKGMRYEPQRDFEAFRQAREAFNQSPNDLGFRQKRILRTFQVQRDLQKQFKLPKQGPILGSALSLYTFAKIAKRIQSPPVARAQQQEQDRDHERAYEKQRTSSLQRFSYW